mgnify:FL=1
MSSLQQLRDEWREQLREASEQATRRVADMDIANLRALRATIREEKDDVRKRLPGPGAVAVAEPMTADEQARHVRDALLHAALQVREQIVTHELRRRARGPAGVEEDLAVPETTRRLARLAWDVMGRAEVKTVEDVFREVAARADTESHLTVVETWLTTRNPHYTEAADTASWADLRRAVLLARV